jgi:hypothetical protein
MGSLCLWFSSLTEPQLERVSFSHALLGTTVPRTSYRGRTGDAIAATSGSFTWSSGVKAFAVLVVQSIIAHDSNKRSQETLQPYLEGTKKSLAASLDAALSKNPLWLQDIFGFDSQGHSLAARIFRRSNPEMKRPGPIVITLNPAFIPHSSLVVRIAGERLDTEMLVKLFYALRSNFSASHFISSIPRETHSLWREIRACESNDNPVTPSEGVTDWRQSIFESTGNWRQAIESLNCNISAMHELIYQGYPAVAFKELSRLRRISLSFNRAGQKKTLSLAARASWMRIRCLSDLCKGAAFGKAVEQSGESLSFALDRCPEEAGASFWAKGAIQRLELLSRVTFAYSQSDVSACLDVAKKAVALIPARDAATSVVAHLEVAKLALMTKNERLFLHHLDRGFFFAERVKAESPFLLALVWDVMARGDMRFRRNAIRALETIEKARTSVHPSIWRKYRAVELYVCNTEVQALHLIEDPAARARETTLRERIALEAAILGNPYQVQRLRHNNLAGL